MKTITMTAIAAATAIGSTASAGTIFNTTTNDLGNNQYQLVDQFQFSFDVSTIYVDSDLNGTIDSTIPTGSTGASDSGFYTDPEHYILDFGGDVYYEGSQLSTTGTVDWTLSYTNTPGDATTVYSTILFGTMTSTASGAILTIRDGVEWPVNASALGAPAGSRYGVGIADFTTFTWDSANGTLAANVVPGPFGVLALAGFGVARRRRDR